MTEPKITLIKLSEFGYEKENNLFLSSPKKGKLTQVLLLKELFKDSDERYKMYQKGIGKKLAKEIDKILNKEDETSFIKVDKGRMRQSLESWVCVLIDYEKDDIQGFGNTTGVLTW